MTAPVSEQVRFGEARGRWVLIATVLGSGLAMLDATVVNVALPNIGEGLEADLAGLQWTLNGYTLTLAAFILLGGSLADRFGRRKLFVLGTVWFALASALCGLAPNIEVLVAARALQGVGGALLTPGSLAIISASFVPGDRGRAIGAWSGLGGIAGAAGLTYASIAAGEGFGATVAVTGALGIAAMVAFVVVERRGRHPLVPPELFSSRQFTVTNIVTFAIYGALGAVFFLLVLHLQVVAGYSPMAAGTALLPTTVLMLLLSSRSGALAARIGPRTQMALGPLVAAAGLLLTLRIGPGASYLTDVLPGVVVFGLGITVLVAPLTATVLAAAPGQHAGAASGVNNAVARAASLLAVALLPPLAGLTGEVYRRPDAFADGYRTAIFLSAGMLVVAGVVAGLFISDRVARIDAARTGETGTQPERGEHCYSCPVEGPRLETVRQTERQLR